MKYYFNPFTGQLDRSDGNPGPAGPAGIGSAWRQGAGVPGSGVGADGDFYLNTTNGDIYGPKAAGSWGSVIFNIAEGQQGPAGPAGATGSTGPAGADATYSNDAPQALGATAAAGTAASASRADHVHQRDTDLIVLACSDETTALTTGSNKVRFRMPFAATLLAVRASCNAAPTGSTLIVDINEAGTSVLGTKLSIDASETTSTTAANAATITDSSLADDAEISIDIDQIGSTVAGAGLKVTLVVRRS